MNKNLENLLTNHFRLRFEKSKIDSKYTCVVCSNELPLSVRSKAYKWNDEDICIGSFLTKEHPDLKPTDYINAREFKMFLLDYFFGFDL